MSSDWKTGERERIKQQKEGANFKLLEGPNCFRILPNVDRDEPPLIEFRMHYNVGPDKRAVRCGKDIQGEGKCWICDTQIPELNASDSSKKRMLAEEIQPKECFVVQVSKVTDDGKFSLAKPWWVSTGSGIPGRHPRSQSITIHSMLANPKANYEDPIRGKNFNIERTGTGKLDTKYDPPIPDEVATKVPQKVLDSIKPFDEILPQYSTRKQQLAWEGKDEDDDRGQGGDREHLVSKPRGRRADPDEDQNTQEGEDEYQESGDEEVAEPKTPHRHPASKPAPKASAKPAPKSGGKKVPPKPAPKARRVAPDDDVPF